MKFLSFSLDHNYTFTGFSRLTQNKFIDFIHILYSQQDFFTHMYNIHKKKILSSNYI